MAACVYVECEAAALVVQQLHAHLSSSSPSFRGQWLLLRRVRMARLHPSPGAAVGIDGLQPPSASFVLDRKDSLIERLPNYHHLVVHATTGGIGTQALAPPAAPPWMTGAVAGATAAAAAGGGMVMMPPNLAPAAPDTAHHAIARRAPPVVPRPPGTVTLELLPPGVAERAGRLGAHGAACTRPAADLCPERLHRHQQRPSTGNASLAHASARPLSGARAMSGAHAMLGTHAAPSPNLGAAASPLTVVTLPPGIAPSALAATPLSIRQCLDEVALSTAPRLLLVRARVLGAFPTDPRMWTTRDDAGAGGVDALLAPWQYQMVLQLADEYEMSVTLGAALLAAEGEAFFPGLPAADLGASNATLAALRARMSAVCDGGVAEFALWACRPDEMDRSTWGVAFHIVATQCLVH
jgi:hypothetical protein